MRRMILVTLLVLFVVTNLSFALDDVLGWQATRWGMSEDETRAAVEAAGFTLKPETRSTTQNYVPFVTSVKLGAFEYRVSLQFDKTRKSLAQVVISGQVSASYYKSTMRELEDLLSDKYGPAVPAGDDQRQWRFKSTVIELRGFSSFGHILISYFPARDLKLDRDKL